MSFEKKETLVSRVRVRNNNNCERIPWAHAHTGLSQPVVGPAANSIATLGCGKAGVRDPEIAQLVLERRHRYTDDRLVGWHARAPWRLRGQVAAARLHVPLPGDAPAARGACGAAFEPAANDGAPCTP